MKKKKNFFFSVLLFDLVAFPFFFSLSFLCVQFYIFTQLFSLSDCSSELRSVKDFFKQGCLMLKEGRCCTGGNSFNNRCGRRVAS